RQTAAWRRCGLPLAAEVDQPLVRVAIIRRREPLGGARELREHRRRRCVFRDRQRRPQLLKLRIHLAEAGRVLARLEGLRQLDADQLLWPVPQRRGVAPLLAEKLAPEEPPLFQLVLDRLPFLGVPAEEAAYLLRELTRALQRLFRERRPGGRALRDHLPVPSSFEIPPH